MTGFGGVRVGEWTCPVCGVTETRILQQVDDDKASKLLCESIRTHIRFKIDDAHGEFGVPDAIDASDEALSKYIDIQGEN